ncbi:putative glucose-6-phosphate 1-epimerase [Magnolia sinica]|uniref:putative glucose-6-phosphate 1-epimerase n=1 Tax=Magnolia sinica TaxID=86752 RepID=UPI0026588512|nr:putative glucose-6-phosphate 1-epimerase [Magnolia sinica]
MFKGHLVCRLKHQKNSKELDENKSQKGLFHFLPNRFLSIFSILLERLSVKNELYLSDQKQCEEESPFVSRSGSLEQHGFARNKIWTIDDDSPPLHPAEYIGKSSLDLLLKPSEEDLKCWPHCFEFRLRVALALNGDLTMISRIRNLDSKPFSFSFAFHTFFSISFIRYGKISIGLESTSLYWIGP